MEKSWTQLNRTSDWDSCRSRYREGTPQFHHLVLLCVPSKWRSAWFRCSIGSWLRKSSLHPKPTLAFCCPRNPPRLLRFPKFVDAHFNSSSWFFVFHLKISPCLHFQSFTFSPFTIPLSFFWRNLCVEFSVCGSWVI